MLAEMIFVIAYTGCCLQQDNNCQQPWQEFSVLLRARPAAADDSACVQAAGMIC
jgi:hypothetical protein